MEQWLQPLTVAAIALVGLATAVHALLHKRDPRSAWIWIAMCVLFPIGGPILYYLFGFNRIESHARRMRGSSPIGLAADAKPGRLPEAPDLSKAELRELVRISQALTGMPLAFGCRVEPLFNGEEAFPSMLEAIRSARHCIWMASYIFEATGAAGEIIAALVEARKRGVEVRVLLDGWSSLFPRPSPARLLQRQGIKVALFLPPRWFPPMLHINLRNHRKLLVVDGRVAFTGGMNICDRHVVSRWPSNKAIVDLHCKVTGAVVQQLEEAFRLDWRFAAGEELPPLGDGRPAGDAACRVILDGPNEELGKLVMVLTGAIATAHQRIWIMTPYFLPPAEIVVALQSAALRGIDVQIILPRRSDQPWVDWGTRHLLGELLRRKIRVFYRAPPFAHSKLFLVDDYYVHLGSANFDARSLRLNFELVLEVYDPGLVARLAAHFEQVRRTCTEVTADQLRGRSLPARTRDGVAWLCTPYL